MLLASLIVDKQTYQHWDAQMKHSANTHKNVILSIAFLVIGFVIALIFIYNVKSDYISSEQYFQKSISQELVKIKGKGELVEVEKATSLITFAADRTYENHIINVLYLLLLLALGALFIYSIIIIRLKTKDNYARRKL